MNEENKKLNEEIKQNELLQENSKFVKDVFEFIEETIETEDKIILRKQISKAYSFLPFLIKVKGRAEALYRLKKQEAAIETSKEYKGDGRKAMIDGHAASYCYARDFLQGLYETLDKKISASKIILTSLDKEFYKDE